MIGFIRRAAGRIRGWAARRPVSVLAGLALAGAVAAGTGGYYAYRTYEWVEHDNEFCLSCHLMREPHELFAESAHRGLGCKACHMPTFAARSQMALTQVLENPDTLAAHAEVPNEKCASCHIEGDPEQWEIVANSAGHRVHLESDDASLEGLQCVQCHSSSLHQFTATDQTCGQSGCHTDVRVQLGRMGDFTIHCAACHAFAAPIADTASVAAARVALAPTRNECLSCHVMRTLVDMPPDEPHRAVCSTCHNPHTQTEPAQAVETCATVGCHDAVQELTAFHRGLEHPVVEDCSACHGAHEFRVDGSDCLACHQDIFDDAPAGQVGQVGQARGDGTGTVAAVDAGRAHTGVSFAGLGTMPRATPAAAAHVPVSARPDAAPLVLALHMSPASPRPQQVPPTRSGETVFRHASHRGVDCTECHSSEERHGAVTVIGMADCRSCHHTGPAADACQTCHTQPSLAGRGLSVQRAMDLTVGRTPVRTVPFEHIDHQGTDCATCHGDGLQRPFEPASCDSCHEDHHTATVGCMTCHADPPADAHTVQVHVGCGGSGCHTDMPFEGLPRDRNACLVCHQDLTDHRPGQECVACHALPAPARGALP